jgi:hypothetical protein
MNEGKPLPSIPVYAPSERVLRVIGAVSAERIERRIRLRGSVDQEAEQRAQQQQIEGQDTFWKLRMRNRP